MNHSINSVAEQRKSFCYKRDIQWLSTDGKWIVNRDQPDVIRILRGVNVCGMEFCLTGDKTSISLLETICDHWPINIVRLPINQTWWINNKDYRTLIYHRVEALKAKGVYTLIDLQWIDNVVEIAKLPNDDSITMWQSIAQTFCEEPAVLYDIYNEPHDVEHGNWKYWADKIIETIRGIHKNSLIWVSGVDWGYDLRGFIANPLSYDNIVYSTHIYPQRPGSGGNFPADYETYWAGMLAKNRPVFAGEFGPKEDEFNDPNRMNTYLYPLLQAFDRMQIGWTAWSWNCNPYLTEKKGNNDPTLFGKSVYAHLRELHFSDEICIRSNQFGSYLSGGWKIGDASIGVKLAEHSRSWERWIIENPNDPGSTELLFFGDTVMFRSAAFDGSYLSRDKASSGDGEVKLAPQANNCELWVVENPCAPKATAPIHFGETIALRANNSYLSGGWQASDGATGVKTVPHCKAWEEWMTMPFPLSI